MTSARWSTTWWVLCVLALAACSDDPKGDGNAQPRSPLLDRAASAIAADALNEAPSADFTAARARLMADVPTADRSHARSFVLGAGRGSAVVGDIRLTSARRAAAASLGAFLDATKESDGALAQVSMDALLAEVQRRLPGATSCEALGAKADDCTAAFLILEVQRSEAPRDAGAPPADGGTPDGGDAGTAPVTAIACPTVRDTTGAREVMGSIQASETWSGKILIKGSVSVYAVTITILPGTEIYMEADSAIAFGWNGNGATVIAEGTEAQPIRFCGRVAEPGFWNTVEFESNVTSNSVLRNVLFSDGAGTSNTAALELSADLLVDNVQVRNAGAVGVQAVDFKAGSTRLSVDGAGGAALVLTGEGALTRFPRGGFFSGNADNVARIRFNTFTQASVVHAIGVPYVQEGSVTTTGGSLTFEAGVDYRFQPDRTLEIGWNANSAGVYVNGTAAAPVVFRGTTDTSAAWAGLIIGSNVSTDSNLTYLEIRQGGGGTQDALEINSAIKLDHVTLRNNTLGVHVSQKGLAPSSTALTVTETKNYPVVVVGDGIYTLPAGGAYTGNMTDQIRFEGGSLGTSGTIPDLGVPYLVGQTTRVVPASGSGGITLTIAPGTEFVMSSGVSFEVGWNGSDVGFTANGTVAAPIRFTGASATAGFWGQLIIGTAVRPNSSLSYVEIGHGGLGNSALLELGVAIPVSNSRFFDSPGYGIEKLAGNAMDYAAMGNTFERLTLGNVQAPL